MNKLNICFFWFLLAGCSATNLEQQVDAEQSVESKVTQSDERSDDSGFSPAILQHVSIGMLLKSFYCSEQRWPKDVAELEAFDQSLDGDLPTDIDWAKLKHDSSRFDVGETVLVDIPSALFTVEVPEMHSVSSVPKACDSSVEEGEDSSLSIVME